MDLQFFNLVGKRETKGTDEATVMLEPTRGNFRISPKVALQLGITDGSFVTVQEAVVNAETGETQVFIGKGKDGVPAVDEAGNFIVDGRGRKKYTEDGFGASVKEINPGTNIYRFSVASAWESLKGDTDKRMYFTLGEGVNVNVPIGDGAVHTTTLYPFVFDKEEDKMVRGGNDDADDAPQAQASQDEAQFEEEVL